MEPVATLTGKEFPKSKKGLVEQVGEYFESLNNFVHNDELGDVVLNKRGIKSSISHGLGRNKAISFASVPNVIQNGKIIDYQVDWKGRGYDTAVLSAPITINGEQYLQAIVVKRAEGSQSYYLHEVITEKRASSPIKTGTTEIGSTPSDAPGPLLISILQKVQNINENIGIEPETSPVQAASQIAQEYFNPLNDEQNITSLEEAAPPATSADKQAAEALKADIYVEPDSYAAEVTENGKEYTFAESDIKTGKFCRSTTVAVIGGEETAGMERRARDSVTGKTYRVPADMTYGEWQKQYLQRGKTATTELKKDAQNDIINIPKTQNRIMTESGAEKYRYVQTDAISKLKSSDEIAKYFEYEDQWGDVYSPIDASFRKLSLETQKEIAEGLEYARVHYGFSDIGVTIKAGKLPASTYGQFSVSDGAKSITFNAGLDGKVAEAFQTAVHEMTHYVDYVNRDFSQDIYKEALKNLELRTNSKETGRLLSELVGAGNYHKGYGKSPAEIIAFSAEKVAVNKGNRLSDEIVRILTQRVGGTK